MSNLEENNQNKFMIEKIKERPINKKKLVKRTLITASMAVIFGLIACLTFLILEPVISNWLYPEEEPGIIIFPEDQDEMLPEDMLAESILPEVSVNENTETLPLEEEQIQEILSNVTFDLISYKQMYSALSDYVTELNKFMVNITGIRSDVDWFYNVYESKSETSGVVIANNGKELMILTDYNTIKKAEKINVTFYNNIMVQGQLKQYHAVTNLAVISISLSQLSQNMIENDLHIAPLGSSNYRSMTTNPIVAMGSPMGNAGSVAYGMISSSNGQISVIDGNYKLLTTDIYGSQNATGILFDLQGQIIGVITTIKSSSDTRNMINAIGITDLKKLISRMTKGSKVAYLGVTTVDVTDDANEQSQVPYGAYVKEVTMDSPAMLAGIQRGDIIISLNDRTIESASDYAEAIIIMEAGQSIKLQIMRQSVGEYKEMIFDITLGEAK